MRLRKSTGTRSATFPSLSSSTAFIHRASSLHPKEQQQLQDANDDIDFKDTSGLKRRTVVRSSHLVNIFSALLYIAVGAGLMSCFSSSKTRNDPDIARVETRYISAAAQPDAVGSGVDYDAIAHMIRVSKMRVYTYPLPISFNKQYTLSRTKNNNDRMLAAERRMHEIFRSPGIATGNPEAADFFYVPIYPASACAYHKRSCKSWNERPDCSGCKQGYQLLEEAISVLQKDYQYLARNNGRDHIFPVFYDHGVCMETFRQDAAKVVIPRAIRESIFLSFFGDKSSNCYRRGLDVVLPPFVDDVSFASTPIKDDIFMYFRGNTRLDRSSPKTRQRLVKLYRNEPNSIVTDAKVDTRQMHAELERATFCLVPAGFAPWSYRTVEAIKFECIPVFLDDSDQPFSSVIDYNQLAVMELGGEQALPNLLHRLRNMTREEIQAKKEYIRKIKPLFSWYSQEFKQALMNELYSRKVISNEPDIVEEPKFNFDVDFVYTWVNGTDPEWLASKRAAEDNFTLASNMSVNQDSTSDMRFRDREELRYSLRSIRKNAPWVRKVHIVVAGNQKPSWAKIEHPMLNIVRHEDIFPNTAETLPTFNSFAIETFVDQIPGLSEHFIMMNDDFFIGRPVEKSKFFTFEGYPKVAFQDDWLRHNRICRDNPHGALQQHSYLWAAMNVYRLMDAAFGLEERSLVMHQAYPLTKSLYKRAKKLFPDQYEATSKNKFRTHEDIIPYFLALFTGFSDGTAIKLGPTEYPTNTKIVFGDDIEANKRKMEQFKRNRYDLFFVNDNTSDSVPPSVLDKLTDDMQVWMARIFPNASEFEIDSSTKAVERQRKLQKTGHKKQGR